MDEFLIDDTCCIEQLRMGRRTFYTLCDMLKTIGRLKDTKNMLVEERVALFLNILEHDEKVRIIKHRLKRSQETIHRHFHIVLRAVLRLHKKLLVTPDPVLENCTDDRWRWFKNCLGALDETYMKLKISDKDKSRYRTRKGELVTNVLGVCSRDMQFIYVLPGWEGSAADGRILRDAISRRNPVKVPHGYYYLVDAGYTKCEGFLAPSRGQRYHLSEWRDGHLPTNREEFFNMKHSAARKIIERCFRLLKIRWKILWNTYCYGISPHADIITACCLLHNLIRREMRCDPMERVLDREMQNMFFQENDQGAYIASTETSNEWTM